MRDHKSKAFQVFYIVVLVASQEEEDYLNHLRSNFYLNKQSHSKYIISYI